MITLFLGGARSGKSTLAEKLATKKGGSDVIYLATSDIKDKEMERRVALHKENRPASWHTIEEPIHPGQVLKKMAKGRVVLLDCITILISNLLLGEREPGLEEKEFVVEMGEEKILEEINSIITASHERELDLIVVSNEVGQGIVPLYQAARVYRDLVGRANQRLAKAADKVYLVFAGLPIEIKEIGLKSLEQFKE